MRKDRILQLADTIEKCQDRASTKIDTKSPGFTMQQVRFHDSCESPACIGGWTEYLFGGGERFGPYSVGMMTARILGIDNGAELVMPRHEHAHWRAKRGERGYIKARHAAAVLRNLAKTGEIDWTVRR